MGRGSTEGSSSTRRKGSTAEKDDYAFDVREEEDEERGESPIVDEDDDNEKSRFQPCSVPAPHIELHSREVAFAITIFFLLSLSLGCIMVMATLKAELVSEKNKVPHPVCTAPACLRQAAYMMENMDRKADACRDFWQYACGGWVDKHEIPPGRTSLTVDNEIETRIRKFTREILESPVVNDYPNAAEHKVKTMYRACMDIDAVDDAGATPVMQIINDLGGWALIKGGGDGGWSASKWDLQNVVTELHYTYWVEVFFAFWVAPDDKQSHKNVIRFDQSGLGLPDKSFYTKDNTNATVAAYKTYMRELARLFNASSRDIEEFVTATFDLEKQLAAFTSSENSMSRMDPELMYNRISLKELQALSPAIKWLPFLRRRFGGIDENTDVLISSREYMANISKLIAKTSAKTLNYYAMWRVVDNFAIELSRPFRQAAHRFAMARKGTTRSKERWRYCMQVVDDWMGMATGAMFIHKYFSEKSQASVIDMIDNIRAVFDERLEQTAWMDNSTKHAARAKLAAMQYQIGYPQWLTNQTYVDGYYKHLLIDERASYFENQLACIHYDVAKMVDLYGKKIDTQDEWGMNPHQVNAYYSPTQNLMVFPAGILQAPYFNDRMPKYINYGGIGSTIGHEITHGFDNYGAQYDKNGNLAMWWSDDSWVEFENRTRCLAEYYSRYHLHGEYIDGNLTLQENIADIGGLLQTYHAYKKWVASGVEVDPKLPGLEGTPPDQLFFLAFGQNWCSVRTKQSTHEWMRNNNHSPAKIRVLGTLSQVKEFAEAFNCEEKATMNPESRCEVW